MTVGQLIEDLQAIGDPEAEVVLDIDGTIYAVLESTLDGGRVYIENGDSEDEDDE